MADNLQREHSDEPRPPPLAEIVATFYGPQEPGTDARVADLLASYLKSPEHAEHAKCGATRRPCLDCRQTAMLDCTDPDTCGIGFICRPCAARCRDRVWRIHPLRIRRWYQVADGLPQLLDKLAPDVGAELPMVFERISRRVVRRALNKLREELAEYLAAQKRK